MAATQINGQYLIKSGSITLDRLVAGYSIPSANLADGANFLKKDGSVSLAASLNLGGFTAQNSATPVNATDLVTKGYVDQKVGGIGGIHEVRVVASANTSLSAPGATIDGATMVSGDLVLLSAQTTGSQNGPWVWNGASSAMTRPTWWATGTTVNESQYFLIAEGTTYKDTKFWCTTTGTITVDTTSTNFSQDSSGTTYTNGTGLSLTGGAFSVNYGTAAGTSAQGNDSRITGALQTTALGTSVQTALGVSVGSTGAFVVNGGVLGTPSGGTLTSCTGLPIGGLTGLGTGVGSALAAATGAGAGIAVLSGGYLPAANFPALTGDVTNTAGSLSTTVNNTSSTGFTKYTNYVPYEIPSGTVNGANTTFTLANTPATCRSSASSVGLYLDGVLMQPGSGNDYTISGSTITMITVPQTGQKIAAEYMV